LAQDDYYYEIQLTNKQLVFYFMAGAAGLIVSFLAGVMVGRGVDSSGGEARGARTVAEERIVPEESPSAKPTAPPAEDLTYAQRLEGDKVDDSLKPAGSALSGAAATAKPKPTPPSPKPTPLPTTEAAKALETQTPAPVKPSPKPSPAASPKASHETKAAASALAAFTIQVGAFKDKATAESVVARLKGKGFAAYLVTPEGDSSLFNVRVGSYPARADAERVEIRLRDEEKFKPFIVKN
jgi:cell division protein FtsN